jgi:hypothetical protein
MRVKKTGQSPFTSTHLHSAEYPNADRQTGRAIKITNGQKLLKTVFSHKYLLMTGHNLANIELLSSVFGLEMEVI